MNKLNKLTVKSAKEEVIYIINDEGLIKQTNLYDFVMESVDMTTTPKGVAPRLFVEELFPYYDDLKDEELEGYFGNSIIPYYTISSWGVRGNNYKKGTEAFNSIEEADDELFRRIYEYDFLSDDQRDTSYYETMEEAVEYLKNNLF